MNESSLVDDHSQLSLSLSTTCIVCRSEDKAIEHLPRNKSQPKFNWLSPGLRIYAQSSRNQKRKEEEGRKVASEEVDEEGIFGDSQFKGPADRPTVLWG